MIDATGPLANHAGTDDPIGRFLPVTISISPEIMTAAEDQLIQMDFGTLNPSIAKFPHSIFKGSRIALDIILNRTQAEGAIWGFEPPFDPSPELSLPPLEAVVRDFGLWTLPQNQEYLRSDGWGGVILDTFTMVIPAHQGAANANRLLSESSYCGSSPTFEWERELDLLGGWIDDLEWAYVPLKPAELDHVLFVVGRRFEPLVRAFETEFRATGGKTARLRIGGGRVNWEGDHIL